VHFAVGLQYNSRSDHQGCNDYIQIKFLTIGGAGGLTGLSGGQTTSVKVRPRGVSQPSLFSVETGFFQYFSMLQ
jgi:hypothetical protein